MDLKETDILGDSINEHWYYCSKAAATTRLLGEAPITRILDVGAGSGFFSHHLLTHTNAREAWCVDISYPADSSATTAGKPVHYRRGIETIDADLVRESHKLNARMVLLTIAISGGPFLGRRRRDD